MSLWGKEDQWIASDPGPIRRLSGPRSPSPGFLFAGKHGRLRGVLSLLTREHRSRRRRRSLYHPSGLPPSPPPPHPQTTSAAIQLILWAAMGERGQGGGPLLIILFRVSVDRCEPSRMTFFSVKPIWCLCVRRCEKADHGSVRWSDSGILVAAARESAFNSKWHFNIFIIIVGIWLYSPSFFASSLERKKYLTAERNKQATQKCSECM